MPKITSRQKHLPKVIENGGLLPAYQSEATIGRDTMYTIPIQPSPNSNALTNGSQIYFDLEPNEVDQIDDMC